MNARFPLLSVISLILRGAGIIICLGGLFFAVYQGIIEPNQQGHSFTNNDRTQLVVGSIGVLIGLLTAAFGEVIGVLFAIEENTRKGSN